MKIRTQMKKDSSWQTQSRHLTKCLFLVGKRIIAGWHTERKGGKKKGK